MVKDAFNNQLNVGDKVVYIAKIGTICLLKRGIVTTLQDNRIKVNGDLNSKYCNSKEVFKIKQ